MITLALTNAEARTLWELVDMGAEGQPLTKVQESVLAKVAGAADAARVRPRRPRVLRRR